MLVLALTATINSAFAQVRVPGNYNSIQAAIDGSPSGSVIDVQPGTYRETLVITNTSKSLTIRGTGGKSATIVDAAGAGRPAITIIDATGTIVVEGLTFRNASTTTAGGGFQVQGSAPSFLHCVFEANTAVNGGGGALIASNATFAGSIIRSNTAQFVGGGVYIVGGSRPVFTASEILSNTSGTAGAVGGSTGGGGGLFTSDSWLTIRGGRVSGNVAKTAGGGIFFKGGYDAAGPAPLVIEDAEVSGNRADRFDPTSYYAAHSTGGGVHIEDNVAARLTRVRVFTNRAETGAGLHTLRGRYDVIDSTIERNTAARVLSSIVGTGSGAGIAATQGTQGVLRPAALVTLTRTLVRLNVAGAFGGGIAMVGDEIFSTRATLLMNQSIVAYNQAFDHAGGLFFKRTSADITASMIVGNQTEYSSSSAGGISLSGRSAMTMSDTTVAGNYARVGGGGMMADGFSNFDIARSRFYSNRVDGPNGGGGLLVGGSVSGRIVDSVIADNYGWQIVDSACLESAIQYTNNSITPNAGGPDLMLCGFTRISDIAQFNTRLGASGNNSDVPRFVHFLAAPGAGNRFTVMWAAARADQVSIPALSGTTTFAGPIGYTDVTPAYSTMYTMTATASGANGGVYGPVTAGVSVALRPVAPPPSFRRTAGDYDGDGKADIMIFRPSTGTWYVRLSSSGFTTGAGYVWGAAGDIPVPGDYDGDGLSDPAVYRPSTGHWFVLQSSSRFSTWLTSQWGTTGDVPAPADYDGDGRTDIAVHRPSNGGWWYVLKSSTGFRTADAYPLGFSNSRIAPGDFDGDGRADLGLYLQSFGSWLTQRSSANYQFSDSRQWGTANGTGEILVPSDYDGDTKTDLGIYRQTDNTWSILTSSTDFTIGLAYTWGAPGDVPVPGDYDGDGKTDVGVYRPSTAHWFLLLSSTNYTSWATYQWGATGDIPVSSLGPTIK